MAAIAAVGMTYFNSIKVRLKQFDGETVSLVYRHFNSIKVRLKPAHVIADAGNGCYFNSIKVRLKHVCEFSPPFPARYFNSIKVRLKHFPSTDDARHLLRFQFHKGTIKTRRINSPCFRFIISIP